MIVLGLPVTWPASVEAVPFQPMKEDEGLGRPGGTSVCDPAPADSVTLEDCEAVGWLRILPELLLGNNVAERDLVDEMPTVPRPTLPEGPNPEAVAFHGTLRPTPVDLNIDDDAGTGTGEPVMSDTGNEEEPAVFVSLASWLPVGTGGGAVPFTVCPGTTVVFHGPLSVVGSGGSSPDPDGISNVDKLVGNGALTVPFFVWPAAEVLFPDLAPPVGGLPELGSRSDTGKMVMGLSGAVWLPMLLVTWPDVAVLFQVPPAPLPVGRAVPELASTVRDVAELVALELTAAVWVLARPVLVNVPPVNEPVLAVPFREPCVGVLSLEALEVSGRAVPSTDSVDRPRDVEADTSETDSVVELATDPLLADVTSVNLELDASESPLSV